MMPSPAVDVCTFGAAGDGVALDSPAIQAAIDACGEHGGGTVWIPPGRYLTGALRLRSHITLHLDAGAELLGSREPSDYPLIESRWEGRQQQTYAPLISGQHLTHIAITGRGTINGRGEPWWQAFQRKQLPYPRPRLISFADCRNVLLEGFTAINSPAWTVNPVRCENVVINGLTIINPPDSPNTDGINPDSCRFVRISNCYISVGDDCIAIKAGIESEQPALQQPCRDIAITNCTLERGHGGVVIGSEMSGGVRNVVIANCIFIGTDRGIRLKSRRGRGGTVENIRAANLVMEDVLCPFTVNLYYGCGAWGDEIIAAKSARPVDAGTPFFRSIHFSQITASNVRTAAAFIYGLPEMPVEDISFSDVHISLASGAAPAYPEMADGLEKISQAGCIIHNVRRLRLEHVEVVNQLGPAFDITAVEDAKIFPAINPE